MQICNYHPISPRTHNYLFLHSFIHYHQNHYHHCGMLANLSPPPCPYIFHVSPCCGGGGDWGRGALLDWRGRAEPDLVVEGKKRQDRLLPDCCICPNIHPSHSGQNQAPLDHLIQRGTLSKSSLSRSLSACFNQANTAPYSCNNKFNVK